MTAPAVPYTEKVCPKCSGPVWDQKASKYWGTGFFKSGKAKPRWECKNKECGGAIWDKAASVPSGEKIGGVATQTSAPSYNSRASKPEAELPEFLRDAEQQDAAELAKAVGFDRAKIQTDLSLYQSILEWYLDTIVPVLTRADIGASPESVNAGVATIFIQVKK